jgi:hypothetical protein
MCQKLTPLAQINDYRHIRRCEHGTVHLTWDWVTVHINSTQFAELVDIFKESRKIPESPLLRNGHCRLFHNVEQGYYQFWLGNVAINLSPVDYLIFSDMTHVAGKKLMNSFRTVFPQARPLRYKTQDIRPGSLFSEN